jgi:hypothetical protein
MRRWWKPLLGSLIGVAGLIWVFHDVRFGELRRDFSGMRWGWVGPALLCDTLGYVLQGVRWRLLLLPVGRVNALRTAQAVYGGLFVNETLPMRVGEVVRAGIVARWLRVPILRVLPSMAVERLFDGLWLAVYIGIVALFVDLPRGFVRAADALGGIVLGGAVLFVVMIFARGSKKTEAPARDRSVARRVGWRGRMDDVRGEFTALGRSRSLYAALFVSALPQACECLALWLLLRAYAIPLSLWGGLAAALILRLGTAIPSAPGNAGTWQLICVLALTLLGVGKPQAAGFSLVAFVLLTLPLWALGWLALTRAGLTLGSAVRLARRPPRDSDG